MRASTPTQRPTMTDLLRLPSELPVPQDDGAARHLPGMRLPALALNATSGDTVQLDSLPPGRSVLYVYPLTGRPGHDLPDAWDDIPGARGCTSEACDFRDHHDELLSAGASAVFGLSSQDTSYQREVVERLHLPFAMLSDNGFRLAQEVRLPTMSVAGARFYRRITLIVVDGHVDHVFYPVFPPNEHAQEVLDWLRQRPPQTT